MGAQIPTLQSADAKTPVDNCPGIQRSRTAKLNLFYSLDVDSTVITSPAVFALTPVSAQH